MLTFTVSYGRVASWLLLGGALVVLGSTACSVVNAPEDPAESATGGTTSSGTGGTTSSGTGGTTSSGTGGTTSSGTGGSGPSCGDGTHNGDESDVDCGGPDCPPCELGASCFGPSDCVSEICSGNACVPFDCGDGLHNDGESDTDCGGPNCPQCALGASCFGPQDCVSNTCTGGVCDSPPCSPTWLPKQASWTQNNLTYASELCCGYLATSLLDNDVTSRWVASSTTNQWVIFNLGAPATLSAFEILNQANYTANSGVRDMTLQVAPGLSGPWTDVTSFTVANQQSSFQQFSFAPTTSQYWRAFGHNNWGYPSYIQYMEVGFYGCL